MKSYDVSVGVGAAEWHMQVDAESGYAAGELALDAADWSLDEPTDLTELSGETDDGTAYTVCWPYDDAAA